MKAMPVRVCLYELRFETLHLRAPLTLHLWSTLARFGNQHNLWDLRDEKASSYWVPLLVSMRTVLVQLGYYTRDNVKEAIEVDVVVVGYSFQYCTHPSAWWDANFAHCGWFRACQLCRCRRHFGSRFKIRNGQIQYFNRVGLNEPLTKINLYCTEIQVSYFRKSFYSFNQINIF